MNNSRWQEIKKILEVALEKDIESIEEFLDKACNGDEELKLEVLSLVGIRETAKNFLEVDALSIISSSLAKNIQEKKADLVNNNILKPIVKENKAIQGRVLGDFLIKEKLGEGGFGEVYKATQITLGREAVVKILHTRHSKNQGVIERFKREAHLASRLEHPYCAHIYSFGAESDGLLWIAMEMVAGTPLNEIVKSQGALSLEKFVPLLDKICEVVHTAHEAGIIHRDLKPANVMVISRAGRLLPKLLDFGIAKNLSQVTFINSENSENPEQPNLPKPNIFSHPIKIAKETKKDDLTVLTVTSDAEKAQQTINDGNLFKDKETATNPQNNYVQKTNDDSPLTTDPRAKKTKVPSLHTYGFIGSPPYMAPEQWENGANVDARSDIYSLGILAYQVINGTLPFTEKMPELYGAHLSKAVPPIKENLPVELNQVLQKALAKRPEERYKTALEFAQAFRQASNFTEEKANLPTLDELLKEDILANAPKPLADTLANLLASHNIYQFRDRTLLLFHVLIRYLGILALASYCNNTSELTSKQQDKELINKHISNLYREGLNESEWIELIKELCFPFVNKEDVYPIPEQINLFFSIDNVNLFNDLLEKQNKILNNLPSNEDTLRKLLQDFLAKLTLLLKSSSWLNSYYLVLPIGEQASKWMGVAKDLPLISIKSKTIQNNKAILVDMDGNYVISLAPLIEIVEPTPGAALEVFLLEGKGRYGAKLISFPQGFEIENETTWEWFTEHFLEEDEKSQAETLLEKSPYLGLNAFSTTDARLFFGREKQTENFLNRLRIQPLLAVVGPSGAGKSSFIQAGIIASLPKHWLSITIRPGPSPLSTLSAKLLSAGIETIDLKNNLQKNDEYLADILRQFARQNNLTILLVVDQFEEIITLCLDKQEQSIYLEAIMSLVRSNTEALKVVLTMRDDFLVRAKELNALQNRLNQAIEILTTPDSIQLLRILTLPARRAGYEFEDEELPREIINALTGQTSALPMLSFTASKIWEQRDKQFKQLTRRSYKAMGGVAGALAKYAEEVLEQMTKSEQALVREVFRHLITSEGTRSILTHSELLQLLGNNKDSEAVLEKLISSRLLLVAEGEKGIDQVEIIHEALLSTWPRLVKWQQEDKEGSRLRDQLRDAARQWQERNRPNGLLWRGEALDELKLWQSRHKVTLTDTELAFTKLSFAESTRSQRRRQIVYSAAFAVLSVALITAFWINQQINNQLLDSYLDEGIDELFNGRPMQAALYFNEVYKNTQNTAALSLLLGQAMKSVEVEEIASFNKHSLSINQACFSPDGRRVVTASDDYTARVWDVATSETIFLLKGHEGKVLSATFSHDGKLIATASQDQTIKIWDATNGNLISTLVGHKDIVYKLQFSPDDKQIATASEDKTVKIWDVLNNQVVITIENTDTKFTSVAFSPDGKTLLTTSDETVKLWDSATGKFLRTIGSHAGLINSAVFSADGSKIATTSVDQTTKVWNAITGKLLISIEGYKSAVRSVEFSADGRLLVTTSEKSIKLNNAANGKILTSLTPHIGHVWSASFNKDANQIVTASYDGTSKVLDISQFTKTEEQITNYSLGTPTVEYSKDGKYILSTGNGNLIKIFDSQSKKVVKTIEISNKQFKAILAKFSPDAKQIVTANYQNTLDNNLSEISIDKTAKVWDAKTGNLLLTLLGHEDEVRNVAFNSDGTLIATCSSDKTAKIWDAKTGKLQITLVGHKGSVNSVEFSPNNQQILTASEDTTAKVWNLTNGQILYSLQVHSLPLICAAFSPDGSKIFTSSTDLTTKIIKTNTKQILLSLDDYKGVKYCASSLDGSLVATVGENTTQIWDSQNGKLVFSLEGNSSANANDAAFSHKENNLVTTSFDGAVIMWELPKETRTPPEIEKILQQRVPFQLKDGQLIPVSNNINQQLTKQY